MSTQDTHVDFIQARLPIWLKRASRERQQRFKSLTQQLQRDSDALNARLVDLPAPETFTRNLLQVQPEIQAWPAVNGFGGAGDAIRRARVRRSPYSYEPSLSVVEAAMRNYAPDEAVTGSDFDNKGQLFIQGKPQEFRPWGVPSDTTLLPTTPAEFARLCRRMDAGGAYRKVLERRLPRIGGEVPAIASAYMAYARSLLTHDAYEAKLDGRLDETGERLLASVGIQLQARPVAPLACEVKSLELLSVPLFGARVYWGVQGDAQGVRPIVLHMPHDVVAPLKQFSSLQAMSAELTERVRRRSYRESLMRYLPLRLQAWLGAALHDQVEWEVDTHPNVIQEIYARITGWREGERGEDGGRIRVPMPKVSWSLIDLREAPWPACYHEWRAHAFANASALMVSTEAQDREALMARLAYWESLVERTLMLAATFFPFCAPIGMTAAAVGGVRLVYEIFEGIQAFNEGHAQEGIEHIFNVLFGIAQGAYLGFVGGTVEPMPVGDGSTRLWNGDVRPFEARRLPPVEAEQDAWGVWRTTNEAWVRIDDRYFEVQGTNDALDLRLPAGHQGVRPPLEWSRARGWQWAHRNPLQRGRLELLRNFAETPTELDDNTIFILQRQVGISDAHLRYLQVEGQPMPAILADALDEARCWQQVQYTIGRLLRNETPRAGHLRIVQTVAELPGWPSDLTLRYHDGVTLHSIGDMADTRSLYLYKADLEHDAWAERILAGLSTPEQTSLLGQASLSLSPLERSRLLAGRWGRYLQRNARRVVDAMTRSTEADPLAGPVARAFPGLPESIANELASQALGQDRVRLYDGRVGEGLGSRCAEALRELRLSRALRALDRGESGVDRDRIIMGLVGSAPQLKGQVRLRLFLRELENPLEAGETGPLKIIRQEGEQYRPFDDEGNELANALDLEDALLRALPDDARQALGLNIWQGATLRSWLLAQALDDRPGLRPYLLIKPLGSRGVRPQWLNGRLGYPFSGRGRLPLQVWSTSLQARLERLYPSHAGIELARLQEILAREASRQGLSVENLVTQRENQWTTLDQELHQWEIHEGLHHPAESGIEAETRRSLRQDVAAEIRRAWRRAPDPDQEGGEQSLRLVGHNIGRLPPISVRFEHVEELVLVNMGLSEDPSAFLRMFPNLDTLHLHDNSLTAVPMAASELPALIELSLSNNPLNMDADVFAPLLGADSALHVRMLHLSGISSGGEAGASAAMVAAIDRLSGLSSLRELVWADNLHFTPQELQAITALPRLRALDLVRCGLRLDEQGSAFLRRATGLEDLRLSGNNCRDLPDLPELVNLQELELSNTGLDRVPALVLTVLSRPSSDMLILDLRNNRIANIQDDLLPALVERPRDDTVGLWLDDNPLPSAQIQALRAMAPEAFRYTVDDWLYLSPDFQRALEVARDDPGDRRFIDWFSGALRDADVSSPVGVAFGDRQRAATVLRRYTGYQDAYSPLPELIGDFDQQLRQLRVRLQARSLDRQPPDLAELELHFSMFEAVQRARLAQRDVPFEGFLFEQYAFWTYGLAQRYPLAELHQAQMTRETFIDWLCDAQDTFNNNDQTARTGEMTWRPYLGLMSQDWSEGLAIWDVVDDDLVDAFSGPVNPSRWPQVLLDNLAHPDADLPSPLESFMQGDRIVWHRVGLEAVADVDWATNQPVTLTEDQLRRTMAIYRSLKSREVEALVRRITTELVSAWWTTGAR
ncbi:leucine-rich repeat domain-containing protein [Pseudomonas brassicacearum]|uniref:leucine-rich repeat domain-containing protein n=1 Tax=Pseudomonas brassicacearum TaxID=930166 RepID=UPI001297A483|nr:leucine-rich repeat domain-containing protein [Pseudomonas brassicacearum]QGA50210.1 leucine-rich repeat domain-containing protein [Pseudomonas brassicacearum]